MSTKRRKKSAKRVARGKKLARSLPRDKKGKFLPRGSKNLFKGGKKRRRKSSGRKRPAPKRKRKLTRRRSAPALMRGRGRGVKSSDNFPNFLSGVIASTVAANQFVTSSTFTPIPRLKTIGNRATVMELLWLDAEFRTELITQSAEVQIQFSIGAPPTGILSWADPRVFAQIKMLNSRNQVGAAGVGLAVWDGMRRFEMQSMDGFGFLLASDSFNVSLNKENTNATDLVRWRLYYRFVDIPLAEFVGIVQSNQQS